MLKLIVIIKLTFVKGGKDSKSSRAYSFIQQIFIEAMLFLPHAKSSENKDER